MPLIFSSKSFYDFFIVFRPQSICFRRQIKSKLIGNLSLTTIFLKTYTFHNMYFIEYIIMSAISIGLISSFFWINWFSIFTNSQLFILEKLTIILLLKSFYQFNYWIVIPWKNIIEPFVKSLFDCRSKLFFGPDRVEPTLEKFQIDST